MPVADDVAEDVRKVFGDLFDTLAGPERARAVEDVGFDPGLWSRLVEVGGTTLATPQAHGGGGGDLVTLGVVVAEAGRTLAPVPLVEAAVAGRALASLDTAVDPSGVTVFSPRPAHRRSLDLAVAGRVADVIVCRDGDQLLTARPQVRGDAPANLGSLPLADVDLHDVAVLGTGEPAARVAARALDEWRALTAAGLVGLGRGALALGIDYVQERHQFGRPIGAFQAVAHRFADVATNLRAVELLARRTLQMLDDHHPLAGRVARFAFALAARAAQETTDVVLHAHGGYGFMLEYDIQLFHRRAKAWPLQLGDPGAELVDAGRDLVVDGPVAVDHLDAPELAAFRDEIRGFLAEHLSDEIRERVRETGTVHDRSFYRALADAGYVAAGWPARFGGQDRDPLQMYVFHCETTRAAAPLDGLATSLMVANTLRHVGTEHQTNQVIPQLLRGQALVCLGYSEPDAGSDVAAVRTRAVRDGDTWVINGTKQFTTLAHEADYVFLLARTNPDAPKHRGLTMFLVPMGTPGIEVAPIHTLGGERTNVTYYTDVRVPDSCRVGEVDGGWDVMLVALTFERGAGFQMQLQRVLDHAAGWAAAPGPDGRRPVDDARVAETFGLLAAQVDAAHQLGLEVSRRTMVGELAGVEGSMSKLYSSEAFVAGAARLLDLLGPAAVRQHDPGFPVEAAVEHAYRHAAVTTIYGGTSEVQRKIIAEQGLGLPRSS